MCLNEEIKGRIFDDMDEFFFGISMDDSHIVTDNNRPKEVKSLGLTFWLSP